jgi:hypothetical protein
MFFSFRFSYVGLLIGREAVELYWSVLYPYGDASRTWWSLLLFFGFWVVAQADEWVVLTVALTFGWLAET